MGIVGNFREINWILIDNVLHDSGNSHSHTYFYIYDDFVSFNVIEIPLIITNKRIHQLIKCLGN